MKRLLTLFGLLAFAGTGCIHTKEIVIKDDARTPVSFENDTAGRLFYETLVDGKKLKDRTESTVDVSLPVVFSHERKVVRGPNAAFNEAVAECDTNHDGRITEAEALIFAGRMH